MTLLYSLAISTLVGGALFVVLMLLRPVTGRVFSKTWHYYCLLVPLIFFLGGTNIAANFLGVMPQRPNAVPQAAQVIVSQSFTVYPVFNPLPTLPASSDNTDATLPSTPPFLEETAAQIERWQPLLLAIWGVGVVSFLTLSAGKYMKYRRLVLKNAHYTLDIGCKLPIVISHIAHTPMLIGIIKPVIILPAIGFSAQELDMVLAHEMMHYRRKDLFVKLLLFIAKGLHWFNPAIYALGRQLDVMCEFSCDEKVVQKMDSEYRLAYGKIILQVLRHSTVTASTTSNIVFATNLCNSKKNFKRRLISIMNTKKMKKSIAAVALATGMIIVGGGLALSGGLRAAMPVSTIEPAAVDVSVPPLLVLPPATADMPTENIPEAYALDSYNTSMQWPIGEFTRISSPFGLRVNPVSGQEEFHSGLDLPAPVGTHILAVLDGYVAFAGWLDGFGNTVIIDHGDDISTVYAHAYSVRVQDGQFVQQGEIIAYVGDTGYALGPHLHFEVRMGGYPVDPLVFFNSGNQSDIFGRARSDISAEQRYVSIPEPVEHLVYTIEGGERNIRFELAHIHLDGYPTPYYLSFEDAARTMAEAIYGQFGFCINGMNGAMFFVEVEGGGLWIGNIFSEELTAHSFANELFHFAIDAISGEVRSLYMNTVDTPFNG